MKKLVEAIKDRFGKPSKNEQDKKKYGAGAFTGGFQRDNPPEEPKDRDNKKYGAGSFTGGFQRDKKPSKRKSNK